MWKLSASERLSRWKDFRKLVNTQSIEQAICSTVEFWHSCPFTPYYLDADQPDLWPTPWQLISENYYCDLAKVLGIVYTLYLTDHCKELDAEIHIYRDASSGATYNLAIFCQGKYVINLVEAEVVNISSIKKEFKLTHSYTSKDLKIE